MQRPSIPVRIRQKLHKKNIYINITLDVYKSRCLEVNIWKKKQPIDIYFKVLFVIVHTKVLSMDIQV